MTIMIPAMVPGSVSSGVVGRVWLTGAGFRDTGMLQSGPEIGYVKHQDMCNRYYYVERLFYDLLTLYDQIRLCYFLLLR